MVHPATGYMVCRTLGAVPEMADAAIEQLAGGEPPLHSQASLPPEGGAARGADRGVEAEGVSEADTEAMAARVWETAWPKTRIRQREFFNFGMDILLVLDLHQIRQFFAGFFSLSDYHWQGFLSMRLSFSDLVIFGRSLRASSRSRTTTGRVSSRCASRSQTSSSSADLCGLLLALGLPLAGFPLDAPLVLRPRRLRPQPLPVLLQRHPTDAHQPGTPGPHQDALPPAHHPLENTYD